MVVYKLRLAATQPHLLLILIFPHPAIAPAGMTVRLEASRAAGTPRRRRRRLPLAGPLQRLGREREPGAGLCCGELERSQRLAGPAWRGA